MGDLVFRTESPPPKKKIVSAHASSSLSLSFISPPPSSSCLSELGLVFLIGWRLEAKSCNELLIDWKAQSCFAGNVCGGREGRGGGWAS